MSEERKNVMDEIIIAVKHESNNNPAPMFCKIKKVYNQGHVDVTCDLGELSYIKLIGYTKKGAEGLIVFVDGDLNSPICISINIENILNILNELQGD